MVNNIIGVEWNYEGVRHLDERVDTLSLTLLVAQRGLMQSSTHVEGGLLSIF